MDGYGAMKLDASTFCVYRICFTDIYTVVVRLLIVLVCNQTIKETHVATHGWDANWLSSRPLRCTLSASLLLGNVLARVHLLQGHTTPNFTYMDNPLWFYESLIDRVLGTMQVRAAVLMH